MIVDFLNKLVGDPSQKAVKKAWPLVKQVNEVEETLQSLSDGEIQSKTAEFKARIEAGERVEDLLVEAFAVVKNACRRLCGHRFTVNDKEEEWNMIPYDVQILGGIMLAGRRIAEMKTGEGKTLVASFPTYLRALEGKGVHVITVNDYLAKRDMQWMKPLHEFLGLTVDVIVNERTKSERRKAYAADITYGTNNEFGFDYLRDNMSTKKENMVQRELHFALVDEVDSILIDEARTPLIISAPAEESTDKYLQYSRYASQLKRDEDYVVDEKQKTAVLTERGITHMEKLLGVENIYSELGFAEVHHIEAALKAQAVFQKDKDYVVKDGQVIIVDEFTGRLMPGRRYSDGLHQALEAKEKVEIKRESKTLATITFQNYFRLYKHLGGMTGTAKTEEEEFVKIYGLEVAMIPTNRDIQRQDLTDLVYKNERGKFIAIAKETKERHEKGQPVLIGTTSIEKSEVLSALLKREGVPHEVLNAKHHAREAEIIANAGQKGAITIATNMAGRGTDIKLGEGVKELGGLCIIGSERHESRRIDNQLRGRAGRQGDPGETRFYLSLEDTLLRLFGSGRLQSLMETLKIPDDMPIKNSIISRSIESAQKKVEGHHFDMRKHVVQYDDVMNRQREIIYKRRRKLLEKGDIHEDVVKWAENEAERLANFHLHGRMPHQMELEEFVQGLKSYEESGAPTVKELEDLEDAEKIAEIGRTFLTDLIDKKLKELPEPELFYDAERAVALRTIDKLWMEHIDEMTHLKEQVSLSGYAQKNPLHEYQNQGYHKFVGLMAKIETSALRMLLQMNIEAYLQRRGIGVSEKERVLITNASQIADALSKGLAKRTKDGKVIVTGAPQRIRVKAAPQEAGEPKTVGRNEPCPCGSGKKYKKCCGRHL